MAKIHKISELQPTFALTEYNFFIFTNRRSRRVNSVVLSRSSRSTEWRSSLMQQTVLANAWKPYIKNLDTQFTDATCYESQMRFSTDAKLLWECVETTYKSIKKNNPNLSLSRP